AASKTYDGNDTASITAGAISTGVGSETLAIAGTGSFSDKNAGNNKTVTVADVNTLTKSNDLATGGDWANYNLTTVGMTTQADIAKKDVTLSSITAASKTYDGNDTANINAGAISTGVGAETLAIAGTGSFSDKNAGSNKTVTVTNVTSLTKSNVTATGGDWANYNLTTTGGMTTQADIAKKDVTLSSITAASKTYDGNDTASITAGAISTGVGAETLAIAGTGSFSDKNAGSNKTVTVTDVTSLTKSNVTATGGDWANYNLTTTGAMTTQADIAKKDVTLSSITAASKTYDGNDIASITAGAISTGVGSETLAIAGTGSFSDKNAGNNKTVTVADVSTLTKSNDLATGGDWANYNLTTVAMTTQADIAKKDVTLSSITAASKTYDGNDTA
ncbi:YDG domain-containing protein, partial [Limnohabitans planktonicus]